jgi:putative flippase GtrA
MILKFGVVSGLGWLIDFFIFFCLNQLGVLPLLANLAGATTAVLFVFFSSVRRIFQYQGRYLARKLLCYCIYQALAICAASVLIQLIVNTWVFHPVLAKVLVTPLTFYFNFQFMSLLTTGKLRLY